MPRFRLAANAEIDVLSRDELHKELDGYFEREWAERGRAVKYLEQSFSFPAPPALSATAGAVLVQGNGTGTPNSGYAWAIRSVFVQVGTSAITNIWKVSDPSSTNPGNYTKCLGRGTANTQQPFQFSSLQFVLKAGEFVAVNTQAASTLTAAWFAFVEVPEQELWKVE